MNKEKEQESPLIMAAEALFMLPLMILPIVLLLGPFILIGEFYQRQTEIAKEAAKIEYICEGIIVGVESGEDPEYTEWKNDDSPGIRFRTGSTHRTVLTFSDGRVKQFSGVPDFEIPRDKPTKVVYDGNGYILRFEN
jgi:hypothetical protein